MHVRRISIDAGRQIWDFFQLLQVREYSQLITKAMDSEKKVEVKRISGKTDFVRKDVAAREQTVRSDDPRYFG